MRLPAESSADEGPNLTPVIDVVFLLLIFFLVATTYAEQEKEIDVDIPEAARAQPLASTSDLVVNVTRDGTFKISGRSYDVESLGRVIETARGNNVQQRVFIYADGDSALKHAVRVMGLCNAVDMPYRLATREEG